MHKQKPIVSICVQTYNQKDYIKECLDGILMQKTTFPFEIILGEDESNDGTRDVCIEYAKKHPESINLYLRSRKDVININGNPTGRYNFMENLKTAKGKYIAICEGDDYWTDPLKLQKQVDFLESHSDYVLCFHPCKVLKEKGSSYKLVNQNFKGIDYEYTVKNLLSFWNIPTASLMLKRDAAFEFPEWLTDVASADIALVMLYFQKGKFKLLKDYMSVYRITSKGVSNTHTSYRMIHYRAKLYAYLNEYFNYKYEKEIYDALYHIYSQFSDQPIKPNDKDRKLNFKLKRFFQSLKEL
jgi:glycosyltransferase involved in cell wall biosynthesis